MVPKPFIYSSRIRFVDTDASQRIHYTAMFRHFEAAEMEWLRQLGFPYADPRLKEVSFPRVHVECDFSAEIKFDDLVLIAVSVERVGTSSFTLAYQVTNHEKAAAKGKITVVCIDKATHRSCPIPEAFSTVLRGQL